MSPAPQEQTISDKFAGLSEALQVAESKAREATEMRKQVSLAMARKQKQDKDQQLRMLAQQARMERGGPLAAAAGGGLAGRDTAALGAAPPAHGDFPGPPPSGRGSSPGGSSSDEDERRRAHGGSRREGRRGDYEERGRREDYDERGRRGRDEYQETAEVGGCWLVAGSCLRVGGAGQFWRSVVWQDRAYHSIVVEVEHSRAQHGAAWQDSAWPAA